MSETRMMMEAFNQEIAALKRQVNSKQCSLGASNKSLWERSDTKHDVLRATHPGCTPRDKPTITIPRPTRTPQEHVWAVMKPPQLDHLAVARTFYVPKPTVNLSLSPEYSLSPVASPRSPCSPNTAARRLIPPLGQAFSAGRVAPIRPAIVPRLVLPTQPVQPWVESVRTERIETPRGGYCHPMIPAEESILYHPSPCLSARYVVGSDGLTRSSQHNDGFSRYMMGSAPTGGATRSLAPTPYTNTSASMYTATSTHFMPGQNSTMHELSLAAASRRTSDAKADRWSHLSSRKY